MDPFLLTDPRLAFIALLAGVVAMLTTLNVAARPAAVRTGQVALALAVSSIFFMFTRFANLFYLPILATYVDTAVRTGRVDVLYGQIQWVVIGAAAGAFLSWILLPTFVAVYEAGIQAVQDHGSMVRVLLGVWTPRGARTLLGCLRSPVVLVSWSRGGRRLPLDFLAWNIAASAVWTVGALCALHVSALLPRFEATAVLLSGLVNAFAAIAFTLFVDPKAAVITDQAVKKVRPEQDVLCMSFYLGLGNFIGGLLGLAVLPLGVAMIQGGTVYLGQGGAGLADSLWALVALNALVTLLASTTVASRVSAAITRNVATALAVYNFFFLVTRLAQQVYAPILGSVRDSVVRGQASPDSLLGVFRWVITGASLGILAGWLLMPTFVEIYNRAVAALDRRHGSTLSLLLAMLSPRNWLAFLRCLRLPSNFGVTLQDLRILPKGFLIGNVLVVAIHTIGVLAAIYAGALLSSSLARTATLLSSVINGVATILVSVVVDPTMARITDQAALGQRPLRHVHAMSVFLVAGMLVGTLLSQVFFVPAANIIALGARLLDLVFQAL